MKKFYQYLKNLLVSLDQLLNSILGGSPDETISTRLHDHYPDSWMRKTVDYLFKWQRPNHCQYSSENEYDEAVFAGADNNMSKLFELSEEDLLQSFFTSIFTSVAVTVGTVLINTLQGVINMLNAGNFAIDYHGILVTVITAVITGILTGLTAFLGSLMKRLSTSENGDISVGKIKIRTV